MNHFFCGMILTLIFSSAFANNDPVPSDTLLINLPKDSRIVVKNPIFVDSPIGRIYQKILYGEFSGVLSERLRKIKANEIWPIKAVSVDDKRAVAIDVTPDMSPLGNLKIWVSENKGQIPKTVADFIDQFDSYFQIIYDDPANDQYQGMEKSMMVHAVMSKITTALKEGNYAEALPHFSQLEKLGTNLPDAFYYYYIDTLDKTGMWEKEYVYAESYLKERGKKNKFYNKIVDLYSNALKNINNALGY